MKRFPWLMALALVVSGAAFAQPRNDLPQPYRTTRDWGELPTGREVGGGDRGRAGARWHDLRDPSLLRQFLRRHEARRRS